MPKMLSQSSLQETAQQILRSSSYPPLWRLTVAERNGVVTLQGNVPSFYLKQLAQSLLQSIPAVQEIRNQVEVVMPDRKYSVHGAHFGQDAFGMRTSCRQ